MVRGPILLAAALALTACADVAGPTRNEALVELPGTLVIVRGLTPTFDNSHFGGGANYPALPEGTPGLFRADRNGQFRPLFANVGIDEFADVALSADGRRLAWIPRAPGFPLNGRVVTLDLTTGERRTITPASAPGTRDGPSDRSPVWAPDGERLAMLRLSRDAEGRIIGQSLVVTDAAGRVLATPLPDARRIERPTWHPDGRSLTANRFLDELDSGGRQVTRSELIRVGLDGTVALLISGNAPGRAVWFPDGRRFVASDPSGFAFRAEDGTLLQRVSAEVAAYEFAWSPDGRFLAYCGRDARTFIPTVWLWDSTQRTHRRLSPERVNDCRPMWGR